jgi:hypothetical protein
MAMTVLGFWQVVHNVTAAVPGDTSTEKSNPSSTTAIQERKIHNYLIRKQTTPTTTGGNPATSVPIVKNIKTVLMSLRDCSKLGNQSLHPLTGLSYKWKLWVFKTCAACPEFLETPPTSDGIKSITDSSLTT